MIYNGLLLSLRKPEKEDMPIMIEWLSDEVFLKNLFGSPLDSEKNRFNKVHDFLNQNAKDFSSNMTLLVVDNKTEVPVGILLFNNINWKHRNVELNTAIGESKYRRAFYSIDLYILGLMYGFFELNLHKVFGYTHATNENAIKMNSFGGKVNGMLRKHIYKDGQYVDVVTYSIIKSEFITFINNQKNKLLKKHYKKGVFNDFC